MINQKINRLLGIIYSLMNKQTVTAQELAERYEVSMRTIYRDVEALSMAGIPVYARKGKNGGISLTEQFVLDKMLISQEEQQRILSALASLQETGASKEKEILEKLGEFFKAKPESWVAIDFSDWSDRRKGLFEQLREAILERKVLEFDYYGTNGEMSHRSVEPMQLLFKEYTWYLRGFCCEKEAMRVFKVLRMKRLVVRDETFEPHLDRELIVSGSICKKAGTELVLWIHRREAYRIYDRFEEEEITVLPEGDFLIHYTCPLDDWLYGLILSFGSSAKVLEPECVRQEIRERIAVMNKLYE